jgi:undecaprenyl-diphosphatase
VPGERRLAGPLGALVLLAVAAVVPLCGPADAWLDRALDGWRTCRGLILAEQVSDLVKPVGAAVLALAVARALWRGRPRPLEVVWVLAALGAGVLLIGALKDVLDRPRPGAEFLAPGGGSFPSGHVANTVLNGIAILTLWAGGVRADSRWRGWVVLAVVTAIIATARIYGRRHWPSDTVGAVVIAGAYGLLAILHPDARWRTGSTLVGIALVVLVGVAVAHGHKVAFPAGSRASRAAPVERVAFGEAYENGWLHGDWSRGEPDPRRRTAWLLSESGEIVLPAWPPIVDEVRVVARSRHSTVKHGECQHFRVALNGHVLGEPLLQPGWRAYVFPVGASERRDGGDVVTLQVREEGARTVARRAAFSELTLRDAPPRRLHAPPAGVPDRDHGRLRLEALAMGHFGWAVLREDSLIRRRRSACSRWRACSPPGSYSVFPLRAPSISCSGRPLAGGLPGVRRQLGVSRAVVSGENRHPTCWSWASCCTFRISPRSSTCSVLRRGRCSFSGAC